jgi:hypothetical protein
MPGLGIVIPRNGPGAGPILPPPLHGNGVAGATHRYVPERLNLATGASIEKVPDLIGSIDLIPTGTSSLVLPVMGETNGQKYLKFPNSASSKYLENRSADLGAVFTFATLVRVSASGEAVIALQADGYQMRVAGNGAWGIEAASSAGAAVGIGYSPRVAEFEILFGIGASSATQMAVGTKFATALPQSTIGAPSPAYADLLRWGFPSGLTVGATTEHNIVEQNIWPFALDATQRAAHVAAMKAKWTSLLTA